MQCSITYIALGVEINPQAGCANELAQLGGRAGLGEENSTHQAQALSSPPRSLPLSDHALRTPGPRARLPFAFYHSLTKPCSYQAHALASDASPPRSQPLSDQASACSAHALASPPTFLSSEDQTLLTRCHTLPTLSPSCLTPSSSFTKRMHTRPTCSPLLLAP
jgi:hypothetical protein